MHEKSTLNLKEFTLACFFFVFFFYEARFFFFFFFFFFCIFGINEKLLFLDYFMLFHVFCLHLRSPAIDTRVIFTVLKSVENVIQKKTNIPMHAREIC